MKTPMSNKTQAMRDTIEAIFPGTAAAIANECCPTCSREIMFSNFRDDLSRREYEISGMCQWCQDRVFGSKDPRL